MTPGSIQQAAGRASRSRRTYVQRIVIAADVRSVFLEALLGGLIPEEEAASVEPPEQCLHARPRLPVDDEDQELRRTGHRRVEVLGRGIRHTGIAFVEDDATSLQPLDRPHRFVFDLPSIASGRKGQLELVGTEVGRDADVRHGPGRSSSDEHRCKASEDLSDLRRGVFAIHDDRPRSYRRRLPGLGNQPIEIHAFIVRLGVPSMDACGKGTERFDHPAARSLLDTYDAERIGQAAKVVELATELGRVICIPDHDEAADRDAQLAPLLAPGESTPLPPMPGIAGGLVTDTAQAGELFIQATLRAGGIEGLADDVVGFGWRLVGRPDALDVDADLLAWFASIGGRTLSLGVDVLDVEGRYASWLDDHGVDAVIERPDFYIFATARTPEELSAALDQLRSALD